MYSPALAFINWRISGRRVTIPEPRGRKSLLSSARLTTKNIIFTQFAFFIINVAYFIHLLSHTYCTALGFISSYFPTQFSSTELFPALWPPTTAIWGRSMGDCIPRDVNASCSLFTMGISSSMEGFHAILMSSLSLNLTTTETVDSRSVHRARGGSRT